jgi:hypothetical protein
LQLRQRIQFAAPARSAQSADSDERTSRSMADFSGDFLPTTNPHYNNDGAADHPPPHILGFRPHPRE